jgi:hypothetical protein
LSTISNIETLVQQRLEENPDDVGVFWLVQPELRPLIVEAMNLATLITGDPQITLNTTTTIGTSTVFTPNEMPAGALALLRVTYQGVPLQKVFVQDLDRHYPGWETVTPAAVPRFWFPIGLTQFGIYPNLSISANVGLSYIGLPVTVYRPYTGAEAVPFQDEYREAFEDYAAAIARFKEGGMEWDEAVPVLNRFLSKMEEMSNFAYRRGSLRFSRATGAMSNVSEVRVR